MRPKSPPAELAAGEVAVVKETANVETFKVPIVLDTPPQQPHLENFFAAVRGETSLRCPADLALQTETVAHKMIQAVDAGQCLPLAE